LDGGVCGSQRSWEEMLCDQTNSKLRDSKTQEKTHMSEVEGQKVLDYE